MMLTGSPCKGVAKISEGPGLPTRQADQGAMMNAHHIWLIFHVLGITFHLIHISVEVPVHGIARRQAPVIRLALGLPEADKVELSRGRARLCDDRFLNLLPRALRTVGIDCAGICAHQATRN